MRVENEPVFMGPNRSGVPTVCPRRSVATRMPLKSWPGRGIDRSPPR